MRRALPFVVVLCCLPWGLAHGQGKRKRSVERKLVKLAKRLDVPVEELKTVGGERYLSKRKADRRAMLGEIGAKHRGGLVPLVVDMALHDRDLECRNSAVRFLSVVGLDGSVEHYLEVILPALKELMRAKHESIHMAAAREIHQLSRWFAFDKEIVALLETTFDGKHYKLAVEGWKALVALRNPELRETVVMRAMREVQDRRSRFAVFERRTAFRENGRRGGPWTAKQLSQLVVEDGTVAVACAESLADLGDPVALPQLRRIDRTSAHVLRIPALMTRGVLQDPALLPELEETLASDHINIKVALVAAIAKLEDPKVDKVLPRIATIAEEPLLQRTVALARLERGDAGGADLLREALKGKQPDRRVANAVLGISDRAADPLVVFVAKSGAGPLRGARIRAIARIGETQVAKAPRKMLRKLQERDPDALRLNAAATLLQLGAKDGTELFAAALKDYDVVNRVDVRTKVGKGRRFNGSPLISVLQRLGRAKTVAAAPLIAEWLDPPKALEEKAAEGTQERGKRVAPPPPEFPAWVRHPLVRAEAVTALGQLHAALLERQASPQEGDDPKALAADAERALKALRRALDDPHGVPRRRAVQALARLVDAELPVGASLEEEAEIRDAILAR